MKLRSLLGIFVSAVFVVGCSQTDAGITTNVKTKLVADDLVKARQIDVDTKDHVVTLSGTVQSSEEESQALQIARGTKGVTSVVDNIEVSANGEEGAAPTSGYAEPGATMGSAPAAEGGAADIELTTQVKMAIAIERSLEGRQITVEARDGVVTLSGMVNSAAEKTKAAEVAGKVANVARVDDRLTVK